MSRAEENRGAVPVRVPPDAHGAVNGHSGLMDSVYRRQRHIYDATRKYYLLGRDRLIADLSPAAGERVLEIGCGTGRNLIVAAKLYPGARFYGIDISEEMLATARANVARAGLSDRITMAKGDAASFSPETLFGIEAFERVMVSYALSMIPDWRGALSQAFAVVAEGGRLHVVDFGQQEHLPTAARRILQAWLAKFHVAPRAALSDAMDVLSDKTGSKTPDSKTGRASVEFTPLYRGYAWAFTVTRTRS